MQHKLPFVTAAVAMTICAAAHAGDCDPQQTQKLLADDGAAYDFFGASVAMDDGTAIIGANGDDDLADWSGAAYIFSESGGSWIEQQKLTASDGGLFDNFGLAAAIDGDTAIVGAPGPPFADEAFGAAYIFTRSGGIWIEQQKLTGTDPFESDRFGKSVALDNDVAVIGAPWADDFGENSGAAYIFTRTGGVWTQQQKLLGSAKGDYFGLCLIDGGTIMIIGGGDVHVFTETDGVWTKQQDLASLAGAQSLTIDGDTAVVGRPKPTNTPGSAHVFVRLEDIWIEQQVLTPSDGAVGDRFGSSVSLEGDTVVIGAARDDDLGNWSGSAYVFTRSNGIWTEQAKLTASDGAEEDAFGYHLAMSGQTAIIASYADDDLGENSGSAYVFDLNCAAPCPADIAGDDGMVGAADLLDLLKFWGPCKGCPQDIDGDGAVGTADLLILLDAWGPCT